MSLRFLAMADDSQEEPNVEVFVYIATLGSNGVGKSNLGYRLENGDFWPGKKRLVPEPSGDLFLEFGKVRTIAGRRILLETVDDYGINLFDATEQERQRIFGLPNAFLACYAVNDRQSFERVTRIVEIIQENVSKPEYSKNIVIVATKSDEQDSRVVKTEEGKALAARLGFPFFETSSKLGTNVVESFEAAGKLHLGVPLEGTSKKASAKRRGGRCSVS